MRLASPLSAGHPRRASQAPVPSSPALEAGSARPVCYVVPFHSNDDDQHFAHLPRLLRRIAHHVDLYVIVERGDALPEIPQARMVLVQKVNPVHRVRRYLEFLALVWRVRKAGCRRFFVRISGGAALVLLITRPLLRVELYYWNSGQGREAWPSHECPTDRLRRRFADGLLGFIIRRADRFVTGPERMVDYYVREYGVRRSRCLVLYNDVDTSLYRPLRETQRRALRTRLGLPPTPCALFVGRVSRYKGGEHILPLAAGLSDLSEGPGVHLAVVGSIHLAGLEPGLQRAANVVSVGSRPNDEVVSYMQASDVFVLPSLSEGFPRVVLEAMACGLPIVAFDVGGVRDILGRAQQEFVVPGGDIAAMVASIQRIVQDPALATRLREENLREVQRFSTDTVAKMFVERVASR